MKQRKFIPLAAALLALLLWVPARADAARLSRACAFGGEVPCGPAVFWQIHPWTPVCRYTAPDSPAVPDTPAQNDDSGIAPYEAEVIRLVNEIRVQNGLNALTADASLCRYARVKSQDMRDKGYFAHESPTYGTPFQMMKSFGVTYRTAGENIAYGYATPRAVVDGWMNSEGHRANILNGSYTRIGVGYVADGNYWTQWFVG